MSSSKISVYSRIKAEFELKNFIIMKSFLTFLYFIICVKSICSCSVNVSNTNYFSCQIKLFNIANNQIICHQLVLLRGRIDCPTLQSPYPNNVDPSKGRFINVTNIDLGKSSWPVNSYNEFKVLVRLVKGKNRIVFTYNYVKAKTEAARFGIDLIYQENMSLEPLVIGIFVVEDSMLKFDMDRESLASGEKNDYQSAEKRLRMAGLLWQALTSDSLNSYGLGRKSFRLELDSNGGMNHFVLENFSF